MNGSGLVSDRDAGQGRGHHVRKGAAVGMDELARQRAGKRTASIILAEVGFEQVLFVMFQCLDVLTRQRMPELMSIAQGQGVQPVHGCLLQKCGP